MKIALFLGNAGKNSGGPEVYEVELLRSLAAIDKTNDYHLFFLFPEGPAKVGHLPENFTTHTFSGGSRAMKLAVTLPVALRRLRPDAVHATFIPPVIAPPRLAYTLPCTAVFEQPKYYPLAIRLRLRLLCEIGIRKSQNVVCISRHVRDWVRSATGMAEERLPLVPLASSSAFRPMSFEERRDIVVDKYGLNFPYFLFSGRWEQRKNVRRIVEAFARFRQNRQTEIKLVLTGERTWAAAEVDRVIADHGLEEHVVDLGKSPLSELPALYSGARALIYPSLWESFGLPIVEAMSCGTPVITSKVAAMPETAGNAGLLVNPRVVEDIAGAMDRIAGDDELHQRLSIAGLERARSFTWDRTARRSLEVYFRLGSRT